LHKSKNVAVFAIFDSYYMRVSSMQLSPRLVKTIKTLIKVGVSSLAIWYLATKIDTKTLLSTARSTNYWLIGAAIIAYVASQFIAALRLNTLFKHLPLKIESTNNIKLYWMGLFYNIFLPGGVGGDGYKVFLIHKYIKTPTKRLIGAILADRLSGLSVILVYLLALVYFINYELPYQGWFWALIPTVGVGYFLFLYIFNRPLTAAFWKVNAWSLLIQGLQVVSAMLILKAMGAKVVGHRDDFIFLFLLSAITASVPITLGGIGARELTLLKGAEILNLNANHAVALSLIFYLISVVVALPGIIYTFAPGKLLIVKQASAACAEQPKATTTNT